MPEGRKISLFPQDFPFTPNNYAKMSPRELEEESRKRASRAPGYVPGKPPRAYVLHDEISFLDEEELIWGKKWGAQGIGRLKEVILSPPTENEIKSEFASEVAFSAPGSTGKYAVYGAEPPDLRRWLEQYELLKRTYLDEGIVVNEVEVPRVIVGPYGILRWLWAAAAIGPILNGGAIVRRMCMSPFYKGYEVVQRKALDAFGVPILLTITGKGAAEPSSVWLDDVHYIGQDGWTMNRDALDQMKPVMKRAGAKIVIVSTPGAYDNMEWPAGGTSHNDMAMAFPDIGKCVLYPSLVGYSFVKFLKRLKYDIIEVPPDEYNSCVYNMVTLRPGKVVCPDGGRKTIKEMEKRGIDVVAIPQTESVKTGGAVHCATCELVREGGPLCEELQRTPLETLAPELT